MSEPALESRNRCVGACFKLTVKLVRIIHNLQLAIANKLYCVKSMRLNFDDPINTAKFSLF
jgi:hypothetical protein